MTPPFDATAGRSEGWLVVVEHGAVWPDCLAELLVAATVVLIVEQPGESRSRLIQRISAGVRKFPAHSWDRTGLVIRGAEASGICTEVVAALQSAVGPSQPLLELRGGEPRFLVVPPAPADLPSRIRQRPCRAECECMDELEEAEGTTLHSTPHLMVLPE